MSQTPEIRMVKLFRSLKRDPAYQHDRHKGWMPGPYMVVAQNFGRPVKEVRDIIAIYKGEEV
jgi:hypothetical protein